VPGKRANLAGQLAVVLTSFAIGYGAAGAHIFQMIAHHDFAANSTSLLLIMDIVISAFGTAGGPAFPRNRSSSIRATSRPGTPCSAGKPSPLNAGTASRPDQPSESRAEGSGE
jgi:hypothetical protein